MRKKYLLRSLTIITVISVINSIGCIFTENEEPKLKNKDESIQIDGIYHEYEWGNSNHTNFNLILRTYDPNYSNECPGHPENTDNETHNVDLYVKNDNDTLFICVKIYDEDFNCKNEISGLGFENQFYSDQLWIGFDVNLDGYLGWPRTYNHIDINETRYLYRNFSKNGSYDDIKSLIVGIPEDYEDDRSNWRGEKIDSYGFGPDDIPFIEELYITYNLTMGGHDQGQGPGQGQGMGQRMMMHHFGNSDSRPSNDTINFEAAFSHSNPIENGLGDYTFEFGIPLKGDRLKGSPIDLDNEPDDIENMGIIIKYYDAKVYKTVPSGEYIINEINIIMN